MESIAVLEVSPEDAEELLAIYAPYVRDTAVSFEYEIPTAEEFRQRIHRISARYPYLKAVDEGGRILGYAYAGAFHPRKAYEWCAEVTIYLRQEERGKGLGRLLYTELEKQLAAMGILNLNACIALPKGEDAHLTMDSPRFHRALGYREVGVFHECGFKFGTWYDMVWMEKLIGEHTEAPSPVRFSGRENELDG